MPGEEKTFMVLSNMEALMLQYKPVTQNVPTGNLKNHAL